MKYFPCKWMAEGMAPGTYFAVLKMNGSPTQIGTSHVANLKLNPGLNPEKETEMAIRSLAQQLVGVLKQPFDFDYKPPVDSFQLEQPYIPGQLTYGRIVEMSPEEKKIFEREVTQALEGK